MKLKLINVVVFFVLIVISISCKKDNSVISEQHIYGKWNVYEVGTKESGFTDNCYSLTFYYEDGIEFSKEGNFKTRYYIDGTWTDSDMPRGSYIFANNTIYIKDSSSISGLKLDMQVIRLDEKYLWFKHSLFGESEFHLIRSQD